MKTLLYLLAAALSASLAADTLRFGDSASEAAHGFRGNDSAVIRGGLGESARQIAPPAKPYFESEGVFFRLAVDPAKPNYFTLKLWGSDVNENLLILYIGGKQVGYRHLGDYDLLDHGSTEAQFKERFLYTTLPLPQNLTRGKTELELEIRATGRIWGYGDTFEKYQKEMTAPSRGLYAAYTHTEGFFTPPADEIIAPAVQPATAPAEKEDFTALKARVNRDLVKFLRPGQISSQMQIQMTAQAYRVDWTPAYKNRAAVDAVVAGVDLYFVKFRNDPKLAAADRTTWNFDWFGFGPIGDAILQLRNEIEPRLGETIKDEKGEAINRRRAWAEMLKAGVNHLSTHRRMYTNQSMIIDMNLHLNNRALHHLDPSQALPLETTLGFLKEAVGLRPWSGKLDGNGNPTWPVGRNYTLLTAKGLTKELGYVGNYGEVLDWTTAIYNATRPTPEAEGDPEIKAALIKIIKARSVFRHPSLDQNGYPVMRIESVIGWRDTKSPGDVCYAQRPTRDASPLQAPLAVGDAYSIGLVQQMLAEGQFFRSVAHQMEEGGFRVTFGWLHTPGEYAALKKLPQSGTRMPMSPDQPDFVWSDEENGVVAVKDGDEILYASLYWRARHAVNFLGKFHYLTPRIERIATQRIDIAFTDSGLFWTRPNWTNFGFAKGGGHIRYPGRYDSIHAGEKLPIAKIPAGVSFKPGDESPYAGRGDFYRASYGPFEIGMNATPDRSFTLEVPESGSYRLLGENKPIPGGAKLTVPPMSTLVLRKEGAK